LKSQERKDQFGEVFTPPTLVREMLDKLPNETFVDPTKVIGDVTGCGSGNFLVEVIKRKIENGSSTPVQALSTTYGVELLRDNVQECHQRLLHVAFESSGQVPTFEWAIIVATNVVCANALTYDMEFKINPNVEKYAKKLLEKVRTLQLTESDHERCVKLAKSAKFYGPPPTGDINDRLRGLVGEIVGSFFVQSSMTHLEVMNQWYKRQRNISKLNEHANVGDGGTDLDHKNGMKIGFKTIVPGNRHVYMTSYDLKSDVQIVIEANENNRTYRIVGTTNVSKRYSIPHAKKRGSEGVYVHELDNVL